jgi:hypothetical protein
MTIDPKQTLFNQPILKIRGIIRFFTNGLKSFREMEIIIDEASRILNQPRSIANEVLDQMLQEKYLKIESRKYDGIECYCYTQTQKGHLLAISKANPAITPAKSKLLVKELRERVDELNGNDDFAYKVKHLKVLGSYSLKHKGLRDVDVAIWLKPRIKGDGFHEKRHEQIQVAVEKGRYFPTILDQHYWPLREVMLFLNTRKKGLNLHFENDFSHN